MTDATAPATAPAATTAPDKPSRFFRARRDVPQLSAAEKNREQDVISQAVQRLGTKDALAFLNSHDDTLDGRPLAIATATAEGAQAVQQVIAGMQRQVTQPDASSTG
jgi:hypothetical protein